MGLTDEIVWLVGLWYNVGMTTITVTDKGRIRRVQGRVSRIIRFLAEQEARFNGTGQMRLEFNCNGDSVRPKIEVSEGVLPMR